LTGFARSAPKRADVGFGGPLAVALLSVSAFAQIPPASIADEELGWVKVYEFKAAAGAGSSMPSRSTWSGRTAPTTRCASATSGSRNTARIGAPQAHVTLLHALRARTEAFREAAGLRAPWV
jgi:hypothetical protein